MKHCRKNPISEEIIKRLLHNANGYYKFLGKGSEGESYYFIIENKLNIHGVILNPGEYVIKILFNPLKDREIKYLKILSEKKLIPKHYVFTNFFIIKDYVEGLPLKYWMRNYTSEYRRLIFEKIKNLITKWHALGFAHGDLNPNHDNILVDKNFNVHFIDPSFEDIKHPDFGLDLAEQNEILNALARGRI